MSFRPKSFPLTSGKDWDETCTLILVFTGLEVVEDVLDDESFWCYLGLWFKEWCSGIPSGSVKQSCGEWGDLGEPPVPSWKMCLQDWEKKSVIFPSWDLSFLLKDLWLMCARPSGAKNGRPPVLSAADKDSDKPWVVRAVVFSSHLLHWPAMPNFHGPVYYGQAYYDWNVF